MQQWFWRKMGMKPGLWWKVETEYSKQKPAYIWVLSTWKISSLYHTWLKGSKWIIVHAALSEFTEFCCVKFTDLLLIKHRKEKWITFLLGSGSEGSLCKVWICGSTWSAGQHLSDNRVHILSKCLRFLSEESLAMTRWCDRTTELITYEVRHQAEWQYYTNEVLRHVWATHCKNLAWQEHSHQLGTGQHHCSLLALEHVIFRLLSQWFQSSSDLQ